MVAPELQHDFDLPDARGGSFRLADRIGRGPTVVVFYRGHWCPYCTRYMRKLQQHLAAITQRNALVVGISPEPVETSAAFSARIELTIPLLSDIDGNVINRFGVRNGFRSSHAFLPHPAVFIFDADLQLRFKSVDRNYKKRTTIRTILGVLDEIRSTEIGNAPVAAG